MKYLLLFFSLTTILPNLVYGSSETDIFSDSSCQLKVTPIITDWSGFDGIDWEQTLGNGVLKQNAIFTELEIEEIRKFINASKTFSTYGLEFLINDQYINKNDLIKSGGIEAAQKIIKYVNEIRNNIKSRTKRPFKLTANIRTERGQNFSYGHTHNHGTLTVTRAEDGPSSWYMIGNERKEHNGADEATVFTIEFHGGHEVPKRLIVLILVDFR